MIPLSPSLLRVLCCWQYVGFNKQRSGLVLPSVSLFKANIVAFMRKCRGFQVALRDYTLLNRSIAI